RIGTPQAGLGPARLRRGGEELVHPAVVAALPRVAEVAGRPLCPRVDRAADDQPRHQGKRGYPAEDGECSVGQAPAALGRQLVHASPRAMVVASVAFARVTSIDWIIVGFTILMAAWGYVQGLIVGALSLGGFVAGAFVGSRVAPLLLSDGSHSPYAPLFALVGAVFLGGLLASGLEILGFQLRYRLGQSLGVLDGVGGAALLACLGLALVWVAGAVALQTPGARQLREPIQRSSILRKLNDALPPSGGIIQALARFDPFPHITGPQARVAPPNSAIARDPQVRVAGRSVVKL